MAKFVNSIKLAIFIFIISSCSLIAIADDSLVQFSSPRDRILNGETNFVNANLRHANLSGLDLRGLNFTGANLEHANLQNADLTGANFTRADLEDANLKGAKIEDVIFKDTEMEYTIWIDGKICGEDSVDGCW